MTSPTSPDDLIVTVETITRRAYAKRLRARLVTRLAIVAAAAAEVAFAPAVFDVIKGAF